MSDYRVIIELDGKSLPSMAWLVDLISEHLEHDLGFSDRDYYVQVEGPPELRIGVVMK